MSVTCSPNSRLALKKLTTGCGMCTSDRCGSAAFMRRLAGSWISSDDQCAASATTTKEGTTGKCYPSPEYNLLPITWTVQTAKCRPDLSQVMFIVSGDLVEFIPQRSHAVYTMHELQVAT